MSGETDQQCATKAEVKADLKELELNLRAQLLALQGQLLDRQTDLEGQLLDLKTDLTGQMLARQTGTRGAAGADIKRNLNRHTVAASVVAGVMGIVLIRDDEIAAWLREVVPRFFA